MLVVVEALGRIDGREDVAALAAASRPYERDAAAGGLNPRTAPVRIGGRIPGNGVIRVGIGVVRVLVVDRHGIAVHPVDTFPGARDPVQVTGGIEMTAERGTRLRATSGTGSNLKGNDCSFRAVLSIQAGFFHASSRKGRRSAQEGKSQYMSQFRHSIF